MDTAFKFLKILVAVPFVAGLVAVGFYIGAYQYGVRSHDICMRSTFAIDAPNRIPAFRSCTQKRFATFRKPEQIVAALRADGYRCYVSPYESVPSQLGKDVWGCYARIPVHPLASDIWVVAFSFERNGGIKEITANIWTTSL